jgi:hypothetical protein
MSDFCNNCHEEEQKHSHSDDETQLERDEKLLLELAEEAPAALSGNPLAIVKEIKTAAELIKDAEQSSWFQQTFCSWCKFCRQDDALAETALSSQKNTTKKNVIYIIRHCEKDLESGKDLTPEGRQHAIHIGQFFKSSVQPLPLSFFACAPYDLLEDGAEEVKHTSNRSYETAQLIVNGMDPKKQMTKQIKIHTTNSWIPTDYAAAAPIIKKESQVKPCFVCWEHLNIPRLAQSLGATQILSWSDTPTIATEKADNSFSRCFRIENLSDGTISAAVIDLPIS